MLVIAHQVDGGHVRQRNALGQQRHHAGAVRPAIDIVAEMHQHGLGDRPRRKVLGDQLVQRLEPVEAAMHVADRIDTLAGRQACRGRDEIDHGRTT